MKVLIFDRKIETLSFISKKFINNNIEVVPAENGSKFIGYVLNNNAAEFDAIIICKKELAHYNIEESFFFEKIYTPIVVSSYFHCGDYRINNIKMISPNYDIEKEHKIKQKLRKILKLCTKKNKKKTKPETTDESIIEREFIYSLPKKSAILLKHLMLKKEQGLSDKEISELFWGKESGKKNCIYNHVYNLRKSLDYKFSGLYIIHKDSTKYKLIKIKKEA